MSTYGDGGFYFLQPVGSGYSGVDSMFRSSRRGYGSDMSRTREEATADQGMSRTRADSSALTFTALEPRLVNIPLTKSDLDRIHQAYVSVYKSFPKAEVGGFTPDSVLPKLARMRVNMGMWGTNYVFGDLPYVVRGREYMGQWIKQNILDPKGYSGYGDGGFYFLQPVGSGYSGVGYGYGASQMGRVRLEDERIGAEAVAKILAYWNKNRIPAYAAEVKRINDNSKGDCERRHKASAGAAAGGGAAAGAAVGTAIAPGPGTVIGALIGSVTGGAASRISWSKDNCSDTRYANYKKALADYADAVGVAKTLSFWLPSGKSKYSELPRFLLSDVPTVTWIKSNIIDPRYAPTGVFATTSTAASDPCYISVTINESLRKLGYPDKAICELAAKYKASVAGANEVKAIVNNGVPYGGKARRFDTLQALTPGKLAARPSFTPSGAASAPAVDTATTLSTTTTETPTAAALPEVTETATVTGTTTPSVEAVTAMGPQVVATPADQMAAQAQVDLTSAAVATVDSAVAKQRDGAEGFLSSGKGKLALGVAVVGLIGGFIYLSGKSAR